jgi:hypothetical protein
MSSGGDGMKKALAIPLLLVLGLGCCDGPTLAGPKTVELRGASLQTSGFFRFSAHQSAAGEITGRIVSMSAPDYSSPFVIEGRVTCIRVVGHRASIGGEVLRHSNEDIPDAPQYRGWIFYVEDNRGRHGIRDRMSKHIWVYDGPTTHCPEPEADSATVDVTDGDVVVSTSE